MPLRRATVAVAAALGAAALAGGCGGGDDLDRVARDGVVRVALREYRIDPQDWRVPAGRVRLVATNRGRLAHNLVIESETTQEGQEAERFARTPTALPGVTVRATANLRPGTYRLACSLSGHDNLGQFGRLEVVARR
jgi:hypothetical protein